MYDLLDALTRPGRGESALAEDAECLRTGGNSCCHLFETLAGHALHLQQVSGVGEKPAGLAIGNDRLCQLSIKGWQTGESRQAGSIDIHQPRQTLPRLN